jgi:hypothetical protein
MKRVKRYADLETLATNANEASERTERVCEWSDLSECAT